MTTYDLLELVEEGLQNGRITPYLAAYITAELTGVTPDETEYDAELVLETVNDL